MKEVWKDVVGYEGLYQVSNKGNIRSLYQWNGHKYLQRTTPKILAKSKTTTGYYKVELSNGIKKLSFKVHQLVGKAFIKNEQNKKCINHKDFNPLNNNVDNLEWVTQGENVRHSIINDRHKPKILNNQKAKIVEEYIEGCSIFELSNKYGVAKDIIYRIMREQKCKLIKKTKYSIDMGFLKKQLDSGMRNNEIANIYNCPSNLIARRRYQYKKGLIV